MARTSISFEDDPLEISLDVEHPLAEEAATVMRALADRLTEYLQTRHETRPNVFGIPLVEDSSVPLGEIRWSRWGA